MFITSICRTTVARRPFFGPNPTDSHPSTYRPLPQPRLPPPNRWFDPPHPRVATRFGFFIGCGWPPAGGRKGGLPNPKHGCLVSRQKCTKVGVETSHKTVNSIISLVRRDEWDGHYPIHRKYIISRYGHIFGTP